METYTYDEFDEKYNEIYKSITKQKQRTDKPVAYIMGGQSGAGKSCIADFIENNYLDNNAVNINGDDYVDYTRKFSSEVTERLIDECSDKKYPLLIEGTLRSYEVPCKTCTLLKNKEYEVNLFVMATKPIISYIGTLMRYEKMLKIGTLARKTTKEQHDEIILKIINNLDRIYKSYKFDNIVLINRTRDIIYNMDSTPTINPSKILKQYHMSALTDIELEKCKKDLEFIINNMEKRGENQKIINEIKVFESNINNNNINYLENTKNNNQKNMTKNEVKMKGTEWNIR